VRVTWEASDTGSDLGACSLEVEKDDGSPEELSTSCAGERIYTEAEPGQTYTFHLSATDNVGNQASAEATSGLPRVTKYFYHGSRRVVMRQGGVVYYLHTDHLGSTSLTTCGSMGGCDGVAHGGVVARQLYHPYGTVRYSEGTLPTDFTYTGQRANSYIKLYQMGARWYDPQIGRWISPDTIVPDLANPQSLNRFSYVLGNPLAYVDPSGHVGEPIAPLPPDQSQEIDLSAWDQVWVDLLWSASKSVLLVDFALTNSRVYRQEKKLVLFEPPSALQMSMALVGLSGPIAAPIGGLADDLVDDFADDLVDDFANEVVDDGFVRAVPENWIGQSRAFKTYAGEDGLSVFEGVSSKDVLAELPGLPGQGPNTTVIIPKEGLPTGTQVIPKAAPGLSQRLSDAHRILVRPGGWSVSRFAKAIKALVGWE
jgi:RHS repeat-associated protein